MKEKLKKVNWVKVVGLGSMVLGILVDIVDGLVENKKMEQAVTEEVTRQLTEYKG